MTNKKELRQRVSSYEFLHTDKEGKENGEIPLPTKDIHNEKQNGEIPLPTKDIHNEKQNVEIVIGRTPRGTGIEFRNPPTCQYRLLRVSFEEFYCTKSTNFSLDSNFI